METPSVSTPAIPVPGPQATIDCCDHHALAATVGIGTASWFLTVQRMSGMDMGVATRLGSFPYFLSVWVPMMAAMMLPGSGPSGATARARPGSGRSR